MRKAVGHARHGPWQSATALVDDASRAADFYLEAAHAARASYQTPQATRYYGRAIANMSAEKVHLEVERVLWEIATARRFQSSRTSTAIRSAVTTRAGPPVTPRLGDRGFRSFGLSGVVALDRGKSPFEFDS